MILYNLFPLLAGRFSRWDEHFSRAAKLDPTLADAFIGLGKSLAGAGRPADAVAPLEAAVKLQPENPVAHYQLAFRMRRHFLPPMRSAAAQSGVLLLRHAIHLSPEISDSSPAPLFSTTKGTDRVPCFSVPDPRMTAPTTVPPAWARSFRPAALVW